MKTIRQRPLFLLAVLLVLLQAGCGLPVFVTLSMPESVGFSEGQFTFKSVLNSNNEPEFRGFELYYRIYSRDAIPDIDLKSREELIARGFRRVSRISDRKNALDKPLIYIEPGDRGTVYTVTVDFSDLADATESDVTLFDPGEAAVTVTLVTPGTLGIRRGVFYPGAGSEDVFKRFNEIALGDADITTQIHTELGTGSVPLVLYALSFGRAADFTDVYSVPLWIGELDIAFPTVE
jgi:hypothetical protein